MLCNKCKKNEAKVYYTEIIGGEKKEQHLCEDCAMEFTSFHTSNSLGNQELTLGSLLSTILGNYYTNDNSTVKPTPKDISCKECGLTYKEFMKIGRFGCSKCYDSFSSALDKSLASVQGSNSHVGKKPKGYVTKTQKLVEELSELDKLSIKLQDAIEKEEFEEAAKIRDRIRTIKKEEINNA